jgi:two-component system, cell cycle response regulator DivK
MMDNSKDNMDFLQESNIIPNFKGKTILIADDDDLNIMVINLQLAKTKANILKATNGKIAVEMVEKQKVDVIFMDIRMPIMDGFEATKNIKMKYPNIPIIAQTAFSFAEDREKCLKAGFDDYLSKPINFVTVYQILGRIFKDN